MPFGVRLGVGMPLPWRNGESGKRSRAESKEERGPDPVPPMT